MDVDVKQHILPDLLPVGYRFSPTDEELVTHYLINKVICSPLPSQVVKEMEATEMYSKPPNKLVTFSCGEREWYFFIHVNEDFLEDCEAIRIVGDEIGFWKRNEVTEQVVNLEGNIYACKYHFTYFSGSFSNGNGKKTHWKMDEYCLPVEFYAAQNIKGEKWLLGRLQRGTDYNTSS